MEAILCLVVLSVLLEGISIVWAVLKAGSAAVDELASHRTRQRASPLKKQGESTPEVQRVPERAEQSAATTKSQAHSIARKQHRCERCGRTWPWDGSRQGDDRCFACGWIPPAFRL